MIKFYATISSDYIQQKHDRVRRSMPLNVAYLLPASSWQLVDMDKPRLPDGILEVAADCGGFVATRIWGDYRYSPEGYVRWLHKFNPSWAATMDYCCEQEVAETAGIVRERQQKTTEMAYQFYRDYKGTSWAWVPTIQGWEVQDYVNHAREMKPIINDLRRTQGVNFRVGIGTLCARADASMIHKIVGAVSQELPDTPFHLWGVKLGALKSSLYLPQVISVDSAAWNGAFKSDLETARVNRLRFGLTKREYEFRYQLPAYLDKFNAAVNAPKQMRMLF